MKNKCMLNEIKKLHKRLRLGTAHAQSVVEELAKPKCLVCMARYEDRRSVAESRLFTGTLSRLHISIRISHRINKAANGQ